MTDNKNRERGYTITRVFAAPRELVWDAWTDPAQFAEWFGGPQYPMVDMKMDVRPEGKWSGTMHVGDDHKISWRGWFIELAKPERLVMAISDQDIVDDKYETFTVTLADLGGKTEMVLRQSGGNLTDEQYEQAKEGTSAFMDAMAELLARKA
jgi:uncharacterized protein YndB with AHSA1/START domain